MNFIAPLFPRGLLFEIKRERRVRPLNYSSKRKGKVKRGYATKYTTIVAFAPFFYHLLCQNCWCCTLPRDGEIKLWNCLPEEHFVRDMCLAALRKLNYIHGESTSVREEMIHYQLFVKIGLFTTRLATFYDTLPILNLTWNLWSFNKKKWKALFVKICQRSYW